MIANSYLPKHVACIMDGNRRWAKKRGLPVYEGHKKGFQAAKEIMLYGKKLGIKYSTVFAFSTENWQRAEKEVKFLLNFLQWIVEKDLNTLIDEKVCVKIIGSRDNLSTKLQKIIEKIEDKTASFSDLFFQIAFSYGSQDEIIHAVKSIIGEKIPSDSINKEVISKHLYTANFPDPDLLIRTGGQIRLSNFLLWQSSYTELYFTDVLWPDFDKKEFNKALEEFARRKRNFGK